MPDCPASEVDFSGKVVQVFATEDQSHAFLLAVDRAIAHGFEHGLQRLALWFCVAVMADGKYLGPAEELVKTASNLMTLFPGVEAALPPCGKRWLTLRQAFAEECVTRGVKATNETGTALMHGCAVDDGGASLAQYVTLIDATEA